jgi:hypothetical protein
VSVITVSLKHVGRIILYALTAKGDHELHGDF